jgi:hypothetical protein
MNLWGDGRVGSAEQDSGLFPYKNSRLDNDPGQVMRTGFIWLAHWKSLLKED